MNEEIEFLAFTGSDVLACLLFNKYLSQKMKSPQKVKPDLQEVRPIEGVYIYKNNYMTVFVFKTM